MAEGAGKPSAIGKPDLARQIEWDADRAAAEAMVDLFFHPDQTSKVPSYCEDKPRWLFRLILVSTMMAALIFDKSHSRRARRTIIQRGWQGLWGSCWRHQDA